MFLNKIVNINVQGENRVLFSEQNYFLYRAYTINKYSPVLIKILNKIVNINVQGENRVLFSEQNYFLYRAYTINKYSPVLIK